MTAKLKTDTRQPTDIDRRVSKRVRLARLMRRWSQVELGAKLGISYQMVQRYETAETRMSAGRLFAIANALDMPIEWFFQDDQQFRISV